jgi:outer membrane lipoprotein-sorting protein
MTANMPAMTTVSLFAKFAAVLLALSLTFSFAQSATQSAATQTKKPTAQQKPASQSTPPSSLAQTNAPQKSPGDLEAVLSQMDESSKGFRNAQADFEWRQYQKVVDETDIQKGTIYFVRGDQDKDKGSKGDKAEKGTQMAAEITVPDKKNIVFAGGDLKLYQPRIDQLTIYHAGKDSGDLESFLVLGFGGRGHDLPKAFDIKFGGYETIDNIRVAKLTMTPKSEKVRNIFQSVTLWIDTARDLSLKQQFFEPSGDYRIAIYNNFRINLKKIPDDVFKIKTTSKTQVLTPQ